jgi:hypothetical protein
MYTNSLYTSLEKAILMRQWPNNNTEFMNNNTELRSKSLQIMSNSLQITTALQLHNYKCK